MAAGTRSIVFFVSMNDDDEAQPVISGARSEGVEVMVEKGRWRCHCLGIWVAVQGGVKGPAVSAPLRPALKCWKLEQGPTSGFLLCHHNVPKSNKPIRRCQGAA